MIFYATFTNILKLKNNRQQKAEKHNRKMHKYA